MTIIRTKTKALGGITEQEKLALKAHTAKWIANALSTEPLDKPAASAAIKNLYAAAGLKKPRVVFVDSPRTMAFAGVLAACVLEFKKQGLSRAATNAATNAATRAATEAATYAATSIATRAATYGATSAATSAATRAATDAATDAATNDATNAATYDATRDATSAATYAATSAATSAATYAATSAATDVATSAATRDATYAATSAATHDATDAATRAATEAATSAATDQHWFHQLANEWVGHNLTQAVVNTLPRWSSTLNGGNMWSAWGCYLSAYRDVLGLDLPEHKKFAAYEAVLKTCGYNLQHPDFCIVSDRPEVLRLDAENRPHCENGPSHRWRDGWSLYYWHGVSIPAEWIEDKASLTAKKALMWENIEQRRAACEIIGWAKILKELKAEVIDKDDDPSIGTLLEVNLPDAGKERFLTVTCGTGRTFSLPVPSACKTALQANAWTYGLDGDTYRPEVRT